VIFASVETTNDQLMVTAAFVARVLVSLEYTSIAQQTPSTSQPTQPATQPNQTRISDSDRQFVLQLREWRSKSDNLATKRAASNDVKQYAQHMITDHTKANTELAWLATQKGITVPKHGR